VTGDTALDRAFCLVLVAASPLREREAGATLERIISEIELLGHKVVRAATATDAAALATSDPSFGCTLLDWNLDTGDGKRPTEAIV
jgi:hypothetical protein